MRQIGQPPFTTYKNMSQHENNESLSLNIFAICKIRNFSVLGIVCQTDIQLKNQLKLKSWNEHSHILVCFNLFIYIFQCCFHESFSLVFQLFGQPNRIVGTFLRISNLGVISTKENCNNLSNFWQYLWRFRTGFVLHVVEGCEMGKCSHRYASHFCLIYKVGFEVKYLYRSVFDRWIDDLKISFSLRF